ncbi:hypothetical protein PL11_000445 [Lentilactobacillus curieae]|uniref:Uncharacterized protein n=1 Tax=Lentilactobacillus curieae TaxID=1138822 RepID=A0A1S6QFX6_9LACO|nr:hypothetical protein [Lentilactobacillus curieae]AQW20509.1 hypothetical protein PL11_000445 [Lentilactobacillus curieae]
MNLDEFARATYSLNKSLTLLVAKEKHFEPVTQITLGKSEIYLQVKADAPTTNSTLSLEQFEARVKKTPSSFNIRFFSSQKLAFGFRIIGKTLVFY